MRRYPDGWGDAHPLTGLMYCADCGGKMYVHRINNGKLVAHYTCAEYSKVPVGVRCLTQHRIKADAVLTLIADMLKAIAEYSKNDRIEFIKAVQDAQTTQQTADINKRKKRLVIAQKRASELEKLICKIYEDNALGKLPDSRYAALDTQYAKEQDELNGEIIEIETAINGFEESKKSAEKFIALVNKYEDFDTLTNTMINQFVEKILIHERDRKGSQDTTQEVQIYFTFVGRYIPPHFGEVALTAEEQEELRKKEQLKDRLQQNYLRRKESGKQKAWEEQYKAKRKAKIDTEKAAIRAEDMTRGVYIRNGDYFIPNLTLSEQSQTPISKYGRMRKTYLQEHRPALYSHLLLSEKLYPHLLEVDQTANERLAQLMPQMAKTAGITEQLKATDQMKWVGLMNTVKAQMEEIIFAELIYL